jgi:hypothetical protein
MRGVELGLFASRICNSADIYRGSGKGPESSINFITCHDGFTLNDLVSYEHQHNEANGEDNCPACPAKGRTLAPGRRCSWLIPKDLLEDGQEIVLEDQQIYRVGPQSSVILINQPSRAERGGGSVENT